MVEFRFTLEAYFSGFSGRKNRSDEIFKAALIFNVS